MGTISAARLSEVFAEIADTLVDDFDVIEFLHVVAGRAAELVNAPAVGLLLADPGGDLQFVVGSEGIAEMLERLQLHNREGPCVDAFNTGLPVINTDLAAAFGRWPHFAPTAVAAGFTTVHAFPMRLRKQVIGGLNLFGTPEQMVEAADLQVAQALADVATIGLLQERAMQQASLLTGQLERALSSRVVIEQAKGAVAQIHGIPVDEAFAVLRGYARRHHHKLTQLAADFVQHPDRFPALMTARSPQASMSEPARNLGTSKGNG